MRDRLQSRPISRATPLLLLLVARDSGHRDLLRRLFSSVSSGYTDLESSGCSPSSTGKFGGEHDDIQLFTC